MEMEAHWLMMSVATMTLEKIEYARAARLKKERDCWSQMDTSPRYAQPLVLKIVIVLSFTTSDETHIDRQKQNPNYRSSPSYCENKSVFSFVCPAGRISFKLYDWNPVEFPRRLRHQIFQWLASMPIELEGYIHPVCTILTAFIAMPRPMWLTLLEEPALYIKDLVASPGSMLSGRGTMLVYLNDMMFHVTKETQGLKALCSKYLRCMKEGFTSEVLTQE